MTFREDTNWLEQADHADNMLVQLYLDGELAGADLKEFERRLRDSPELAQLVETLGEEQSCLNHLLAAPAAPESLCKAVYLGLSEIDRARAHERRRELWSWVLPGGAGLGALAALAVFFIFFSDWGEPGGGELRLAHEVVKQRFRQQPVEFVSAHPQTLWPGIEHRVSLPAYPSARATFVGSALEQPAGPIKRVDPLWKARELSTQLSSYFEANIVAPHFRKTLVRSWGWRPTQIRGRAAAELQYKVHAASGAHHLVTVHIVNARNLDLRSQRSEQWQGYQFWVDEAYGYNVVLFKDRLGVGYVFSSGLGSKELVDLVKKSNLLSGRATVK